MTEPAFQHPRFLFMTGLRAGEPAAIRSEAGEPVLSYRSFASIVGVVATLVGAIVAVAGLAGAALLFAEGSAGRAVIALVLTAVFTLVIFRLVPRRSVTLVADAHPALVIAQLSAFPFTRFAVSSPDGRALGLLSRGLLTRLLQNRWRLLDAEGRIVAEAHETPLGRALARKLLGKFSRRWESDIVLEHGSLPAGVIHRRPDAQGRFDYLELTSDALDPRLAVALATVILGSEP